MLDRGLPAQAVVIDVRVADQNQVELAVERQKRGVGLDRVQRGYLPPGTDQGDRVAIDADDRRFRRPPRKPWQPWTIAAAEIEGQARGGELAKQAGQAGGVT